MSTPPSDPRHLGIVLPAGGARAAFQVGVLRYIAENFPEANPKIFAGVSAGSINACFLAQGDPFRDSTIRLYELWSKLRFEQVFKTNFHSLLSMLSRWVYDMFVSKVTKRLLVKSLLDASPLAETLLFNVRFWKISRAIRTGQIEGLAVSATNYHDGTTTIFYDSYHPVAPWRREQRRSLRTPLRVRHIMASCSIPLLFEPVRVGDFLYGDGSLRFSFPLSPAIKLGATHILAIGIRCPSPENTLGIRPEQPGLGFVAGAVLNSIFLDSLEADYENLLRLNAVTTTKDRSRPIHSLLIRPSRDLGALAKEHISSVPFHFRQLLRSTANPEELGDLLSYLMFAPEYLVALLELGMKDAAAHHDDLRRFFDAVPGDPAVSLR